MELNLSNFVLERVAFEARFSPAYLLWDRSGGIWTEARKAWPSLKHFEAQPNKTLFRLEELYEMVVELECARVIRFNPAKSPEDFIGLLSTFLKIVTEQLSLTVFPRIGMRFIYFAKYQDRDSASLAMAGTDLLRIPDPSTFGSDFRVVLPEYTVRYEGRGKGFTIHMGAQGRKLDFEPPQGIDGLSSIHQETFGIFYDVDFFTVAPMTVDQLSVRDWANQAYHSIKQISGNFLRV